MTMRERLSRILIELLVLSVLLLVWRVFIYKRTPPPHPAMAYSHAFLNMEEFQRSLQFYLEKAGAPDFHGLYDDQALAKIISQFEMDPGIDPFQARVEVYSRSLRALLRYGGEAPIRLTQSSDEDDMKVSGVFNTVAMERLLPYRGSDIKVDPWGNPYQFFVGPWPADLGPILFRCYDRELRASVLRPSHRPPRYTAPPDQLTIEVDGNERGIPAPDDLELYIWSYGANGVSDQPYYDPSHVYAPPARQYYRKHASDEYLGGGDDINNWDEGYTSQVIYLR